MRSELEGGSPLIATSRAKAVVGAKTNVCLKRNLPFIAGQQKSEGVIQPTTPRNNVTIAANNDNVTNGAFKLGG